MGWLFGKARQAGLSLYFEYFTYKSLLLKDLAVIFR